MKKLSNKSKIIMTSIISIILIIAIIIVSFGLVREINQNRADAILDKKLYGTVAEVGKNYVKVKTLEDEEYVISSKENVEVGDFIVVYYDKFDEDLIKNSDVEIIAKEEEVVIDINTTTTLVVNTTSTEVPTTTPTTTVPMKTTTKKTTAVKTTTTTTTSISNDEMVVAYVEDEYNGIDFEGIKESAKQSFITLVDFIFYDGTINGVTWDSLKASTKAKVIYYTLLIDNKIDNKWPNYKENIGAKYNDIKSKLVAKYMDVTTSLCNDHPNECEVTKNDFAVLKASLGLTWDVIKSAFKYAYDKGVSYLVNWYEIYSGKR